ncbi:hypothetical protein TNCV_553971 [Trichonephila clavipes]|nr:hypothetical protein TNCV_553971 [Trichonephila clavipes]
MLVNRGKEEDCEIIRNYLSYGALRIVTEFFSQTRGPDPAHRAPTPRRPEGHVRLPWRKITTSSETKWRSGNLSSS